MLFKEPQPYPERVRDVQYEDTENMPVVSGTNENPCPYWHAPQFKRRLDLSTLDYEKVAGRLLFISMALFTLIISIMFLGKVLWKVWILK